MEEMSDEELRGIILEELWKHRRKGIVRFDEALKDLPMSFEIKNSTLRRLSEGGLTRYALPAHNRLGRGEITLAGINVVEGAANAPFPIVLHQHTQTGGIHFGRNVSGDVEIGKNVSGVERMTVANDQARISQTEKKDRGLLGLIREGWQRLRDLFGS